MQTHPHEQADGATRLRGPSTFEVFDRNEIPNQTVSHGVFDTLDEARGCVEFDRLCNYEIWQGDHIVDEEEFARDVFGKRVPRPACKSCSTEMKWDGHECRYECRNTACDVSAYRPGAE